MLDLKKINDSISDALKGFKDSDFAEADNICNQIKGVQDYLSKAHFHVAISLNENRVLGYNFKTQRIFYFDKEHNKKNLMECNMQIRKEMITHLPELLIKLKEFK